jgi:hypothetical protein
MRTVTLLIDLDPTATYHQATLAALRHAIDAVGAAVTVEVTRTDRIDRLRDGVIAGPGTPYHDPAAAEAAISEARARGVPLVAT